MVAIQQIFKHTRLKHILPTHKRARRERERNENHANQVMLGSVGISKNELRVEYFSILAKSPHVIFFQRPNGFTTKCSGSNLKESPMGPGNFTTKCLALEIYFFKQISIFIHGPRYFFDKMPWSAKVEVGPGPFYKVASLQNDL